MKTFFALIALMSLSNAFATTLQEGDLRLSAVQGELVSISEMCPLNPNGVQCRAFGSIAKVRVTLKGCADRLGGYTTNLVTSSEGKGILYFSAVNVHTERSTRVDCAKAPAETVNVYVPYVGDLELRDMRFTTVK